jgi:hypothetical protein
MRCREGHHAFLSWARQVRGANIADLGGGFAKGESEVSKTEDAKMQEKRKKRLCAQRGVGESNK